MRFVQVDDRVEHQDPRKEIVGEQGDGNRRVVLTPLVDGCSWLESLIGALSMADGVLAMAVCFIRFR